MDPIIDIRPWGQFKQYTLNEKTTVKIISVNAGEALSLQYHLHRKELWIVLSGSGTMQIGDATLPAKKGDEFTIEAGTHHRISTDKEPMEFLEIAFGTFDENDEVRLEDRYGREQH